MGAHIRNPSKLLIENGKTEIGLGKFIEEKPEFMGNWAKKGAKLPYLFKVLSINQALSIQAHPDLELAKNLHEK